MADLTASVGLRDIVAAYLATLTYYVTLHDATGGFVIGSDTYTAGIRGELATGNGYTRGAKTLTLTNTSGTLDGPDVVWTAAGGSIGPATYCAVWISTTGTAAGAKLLCVKDKTGATQTATDTQPMTGGIVNPIVIPTPA